VFNHVWHAGLLHKLKFILPPSYYLILKSYLEHSFFSVHYGSCIFPPKPINAGVPQGAITAPLLFNIFIFNQPTDPTTLVDDFANNKALIAKNHDPTVASSHIQNHLFFLEKWDVKKNKTKSVHYSFTFIKKKCPSIILNEQTLPTAQYIRYLGIIIDHFTWSSHLRNK